MPTGAFVHKYATLPHLQLVCYAVSLKVATYFERRTEFYQRGIHPDRVIFIKLNIKLKRNIFKYSFHRQLVVSLISKDMSKICGYHIWNIKK